ncbi:cellulose synthase/poly-beta-1,6-N-acetylglucosamine synthase-like glycosyltransferase [Caldalkalibacillus uzonensis]|uniref:4,4'-diaponeurosporenoate glycosyltransferase n=1 Tax=Caldalkalibacillus uzonensis TaxID=353224 RepID=A0ABU0CSI4_9BACI|nr:glycosyltransferase family 2 protein [Caldalkalibacillus uzonensis]MDQ0339350.1 cellulose synthase/poly-beta-1,6-N-acetylglucosamine synthase-like glycosyltransferase [Caldalkalibacillus uzonensis]
MLFIVLLAILTLGYWLYIAYESIRGLPALKSLPRTKTPVRSGATVSVIIAAKDEGHTIVETVQRLLRQDYPCTEVIVINDRSRDETGAKLEKLKGWANQHSRIPLIVRHVTTLPEGWLGKNHALYQGYLSVKGDYLLFTDADVCFEPSVLSDAVNYMDTHKVDHLTLSPKIMAKPLLLRMFVRYFFFSFMLFFQPWKANNDKQLKKGMGIGAFNMMRKSAYEKIGTHRSLATRPDDDLQLGLKVKQAGLKQRFLTALDHLSVEWYPDLPSAVRGLEKNSFAGLGYSLWLAGAACVAQFVCFIFPFVAVWLFSGWLMWLYLLTVVMILGLYAAHTFKLSGHIGVDLFLFPASALLFLGIIVRSVLITLKQGGIYWRGTFYSLKELKEIKEKS